MDVGFEKVKQLLHEMTVVMKGIPSDVLYEALVLTGHTGQEVYLKAIEELKQEGKIVERLGELHPMEKAKEVVR